MKYTAIILITFLQITCLAEKTDSGKIYSKTFKTSNTHFGFTPPASLNEFKTTFQKSLKILPEDVLISAVLSLVNNQVGVSENQKEKLNELFQKVYIDISKDKQMKDITSVLYYSLSTEKPGYGHYFIYIPPKLHLQQNRLSFCMALVEIS
jgi:hypothetical protein